MKQIIPFTKDITFKTKIGELTSISLDDDLTLKGEDLIVGNFYIKGTYKMIDTQTLEEEYSYKIPCEIAISDEYDTFDCTIDIDDFYYEIINDEILRVNISLAIDNLTRKEIPEKEELVRKIKDNDLKCETPIINDNKESPLEEIDITKEVEVVEEIKEERSNKKENTVKEAIKEESQKPLKIQNEIKDERQEEVKKEAKAEQKEVRPINPINIITESNPDITQAPTEETYLTYSVYLFREGDDIDKIIEKYKITKEALANYNDLSDITPGTKLVIPSFMKNDW